MYSKKLDSNLKLMYYFSLVLLKYEWIEYNEQYVQA